MRRGLPPERTIIHCLGGAVTLADSRRLADRRATPGPRSGRSPRSPRSPCLDSRGIRPAPKRRSPGAGRSAPPDDRSRARRPGGPADRARPSHPANARIPQKMVGTIGGGVAEDHLSAGCDRYVAPEVGVRGGARHLQPATVLASPIEAQGVSAEPHVHRRPGAGRVRQRVGGPRRVGLNRQQPRLPAALTDVGHAQRRARRRCRQHEGDGEPSHRQALPAAGRHGASLEPCPVRSKE